MRKESNQRHHWNPKKYKIQLKSTPAVPLILIVDQPLIQG